MATICLQCGDEGAQNALVYCVRCLEFAVHRYCLDEIPETYDEFVHWYCCVESKPSTHNKSTCIQTKEKDPSSSEESEHVEPLFPRAKSKERDGDCLAAETEVVSHNSLDDNNAVENSRVKVKAKNQKNISSQVAQVNGQRHRNRFSKHYKISGKKKKSNVTSSLKKGQPKNDSLLEKSKIEDDACLANDDEERNQKNISSQVAQSNGKRCRNRFSKHSKSSGKKRRSNGTSSPKKVQSKNDSLQEKSKSEDDACLANVVEERSQSCSSGNTETLVMELDSPDRSQESRSQTGGRNGSSRNFSQPDNNELSKNDLVLDRLGRAQPIFDPIWRGDFSIINRDGNAFDGIVAHVSSKAVKRVHDEASLLPSLLRLEMLPKLDLWPKSFLKSEPSDEHIALYFFPMEIRYERSFDHLVDEMMGRDLAMRAILKNAELLVFTSSELPLIYWRFNGKYYLWGVFRGKSSPSPPVNDHHS